MISEYRKVGSETMGMSDLLKSHSVRDGLRAEIDHYSGAYETRQLYEFQKQVIRKFLSVSYDPISGVGSLGKSPMMSTLLHPIRLQQEKKLQFHIACGKPYGTCKVLDTMVNDLVTNQTPKLENKSFYYRLFPSYPFSPTGNILSSPENKKFRHHRFNIG